MKKRKQILSDDERRELLELYPYTPNKELCEMFDITPLQLKVQVQRLGVTKKKKEYS